MKKQNAKNILHNLMKYINFHTIPRNFDVNICYEVILCSSHRILIRA